MRASPVSRRCVRSSLPRLPAGQTEGLEGDSRRSQKTKGKPKTTYVS